MKEILKDPELKEKTRIISTSYADLIEDDQKE